MPDVLGNFEQAVLLALWQPTTELGKQGYGRAVLKWSRSKTASRGDSLIRQRR